MTPDELRAIPLSDAAIAREIECSTRRVSDWRNGHARPSRENAKRLAMLVGRLANGEDIPLQVLRPGAVRKKLVKGARVPYSIMQARHLMTKNNWTLEEYARRLGTDTQRVRAWLDGQRPIPGAAALLMKMMHDTPWITESYLIPGR